MSTRAQVAAVALLGIAVAAYLTVVHYAHTAPICTTGGCETVQHSSYAELAGVPVALLGLIAYVLILGTAGLRGVAPALLGGVLALAAAAFSGYLLWVQLARIHAICQWCVGNDAIVAVLALLCAVRLLREPAR
ncbi:MAG: vitamin K epoxide reductase family protein [Gaiellaceae bacterium]